TAMSDITGDLERAVAASSKVLAVRGQVLPATLSDVRLWAEMADGRRIEGESSIPKAGGKIVKIGCIPANPPAIPAAIKAIRNADYIIIGPGSLYTSLIPNLLVPEITQAIASANVPRIYICNIMTQPGETEGYSVSEHIRAIDHACGDRKLFDAVLVHRRSPSAQALIRYAQQNSHPVFLDTEAISQLGRRIVPANILYEDETGFVRHDPQKLARVLLKWYGAASKK
ncbi:uridine diphosphate-N-acetylglucosamine-binding protein YvcK, partial [Cylindrospermopsis raciborskii]